MTLFLILFLLFLCFYLFIRRIPMTLSDATLALLNKAFTDEENAEATDANVQTEQGNVISAQNLLVQTQNNLNAALTVSSDAHIVAKESAFTALRAIAAELKVDLPS